ncbi:UDP-N-acetylglucosamine 2-epimerase (non-hydrolyzing) [Candidatus Pelagibacter sp.]|nr:UDP-N-acetylglucosamine 2-epimerase (non-hydrolyzing) [Candidatus Pelagibacter sp.]
MKKKILIVVGTRPELLKVAKLYLDLKKVKKFKTYICISGQHTNLMNQSLNIFNIKPDIHFKINVKNRSLSGLTNIIMEKVNIALKKIKPDILIVHGDTVTTYSSALSGFYLKIPIAHIEAGLRTYDLLNPFPEELYRQIVSRISDYHFVPHIQNKKNLASERVKSKKIIVTGNTIIDTLKILLKKINNNKKYNNSIKKKLEKIVRLNLINKKIILITMHRRENLDNGLKSLCKALKNLSSKYLDYDFIIPVHPNPLVKNFIYRNLKNRKNINIIKSLDYDLFIFLAKQSKLILTDSGGIQEEAPSLGTPVLVLRNKTERLKSIKHKNSILIGNQYKDIVKNFEHLISNKKLLVSMSKIKDLYGDGMASYRIIKVLQKILI